VERALKEMPWFWGNAGLFITHWFSNFYATAMVASTMALSVRLPNLPLPLWHHKVLEEYWNTIGSFKKMDLERTKKGLFTFTKIYVEINLSKGLPDHIQLKHKNIQCTELLDYENTTFGCRSCYQI